MAVFALPWASWGSSTGIPAAAERPVAVVAVSCTLACVALAVLAFRRAAAVPGGGDTPHRAAGPRFAAVVAAEVVGLLIVARVLSATGQEQVLPALAPLVGSALWTALPGLGAAVVLYATSALLARDVLGRAAA